MDTRDKLLRDGIRHDSQARRKAQRHGRQKGITITIAAAELRAAGVDPDGPVPEYRVYPGKKQDGGVQLRLYRRLGKSRPPPLDLSQTAGAGS